jgi:hypothetical protein
MAAGGKPGGGRKPHLPPAKISRPVTRPITRGGSNNSPYPPPAWVMGTHRVIHTRLPWGRRCAVAPSPRCTPTLTPAEPHSRTRTSLEVQSGVSGRGLGAAAVPWTLVEISRSGAATQGGAVDWAVPARVGRCSGRCPGWWCSRREGRQTAVGLVVFAQGGGRRPSAWAIGAEGTSQESERGWRWPVGWNRNWEQWMLI